MLSIASIDCTGLLRYKIALDFAFQTSMTAIHGVNELHTELAVMVFSIVYIV